MTYVAIPNTDVDAESPITTGLMTQLRDNTDDHTHSASGDGGTLATDSVGATQIVAGGVGASEIAANAVHQSELYAVSDSQSFTLTKAALSSVVPTGGYYTLGWFVSTNASATTCRLEPTAGTGTADRVSIYNTNGSTDYTGYFHADYVSASPPYDLGDGLVPLFLFAQLEAGTGKILGVTCAIDPPWAYHGPTSIVPTRRAKDGKTYREERVVDPALMNARNLSEFAKANKGSLNTKQVGDFMAWFNDPNPQMVEVELTTDYKNSDMDIVPHLFQNTSPSDSIILLDPVSPIMEELMLLQQQGESIPKLLEDGYLQIGSLINRKSPKGVNAYSIKWNFTP